MGFDIHPYVEYRDSKTGQWTPADPWTQDDKGGWRVPYHCGINRDRHYNWFAFLADVRNETWGEHIPVAQEPRGIPADCCERIRAESEDWDGNGHSHSWLTLGELEAAWKEVKDERIRFNGAVDGRQTSPEFLAWMAKKPDERGAPPGGFCAAGGSGGYTYPRMEWVEPLHELIGDAYEAWRRYMWNVGFEFRVKNRDNDVRVVFWFDN